MPSPVEYKRLLGWTVLTGWLAFVFAAQAGALVIHPNTLLGSPDPGVAPPPGSDPGWSHVGTFGAGSAVYLGTNGLGESWILTAAHLGAPGTFTLGGTPYATDASVNFVNAGGSSADLRAWRLVGDPGLPALAISGPTPLPATPVTTIGTGRSDGAFTCWDSGWNAGSCTLPAHTGYVWAPRDKQWGTNTISVASPALDALATSLGIDEAIFATSFDSAGTVLESQAATGDSGGGAFVDNVGTWELAGIALAIGAIPSDPSRPAATAVLDSDYTFYVDLSFYRDQIAAGTGLPVPEPATGTLVALALIGLAAQRRPTRPAARV